MSGALARGGHDVGSLLRDLVENLMAVDRLRMKAIDIISQECQGRILREFPSQWLNRTLEEILEAAKQGDRSAQKASKLLQSGRFKK